MVKETTKLHINDAYVVKAKYLPRLWKRESRIVEALSSEKPKQHYRYGKQIDCKSEKGKGGRKQRCCRQKMKVDVKDITGFNFILEPKTFDAHYCQGGCPPRFNPTNEHSLLQSLMHIRTRHRPKEERIPRPCCVPKKMLPLEILHLDDEDTTRLRVTHWKNIVVAECGCT